jgi:hypothetical protein
MLKSFDFSFEDYSGGARVKNLQVEIRGVNKFIYIIIINVNWAVKKAWQVSHIEKSEFTSTVSKIRESF